MKRAFVLSSFVVLSLSAALASSAPPAPNPAPDLPPLVRAPTDTAQFRRFVLDNGLRVLLVSDPKFNKSGASLVVNAGALDDPPTREGLAHFLEHMLFISTEKYPEVNAYSNFIKQNGGYDNAYTASDHTNFQFEVRHDALPEALDRFAQFFIAPGFNAEYTGREINAVHNEAMRHVQNDGRRLFNVRSELYLPGSPESKFGTGNKDTLGGATPAEVRAFYEAHYTAERMALAIAGKASLDDLEKLAREKFSSIPRRNLPPLVHEQKFLAPKPALRIAFVEPVKEVRTLSLEFPVPATRPDFAHKPDRLLGALLDYSGDGGLEHVLKAEGLANNIGGGIYERTSEYGSMLISADLTPEGAKNYGRVLALIFAYFDHLRASPFPAEFYAERAKIAALNETYHDRGEGSALATSLANDALFYPLGVAERAEAVWGAPDEPSYRRLLAALTSENALVALMAKGLPTDKHERIYGTAYSYREETGPAYDALLHPPKVAAFALPQKNRFMPGEAPLLAERPLPLIDEPGVKLFYAEDTEFQRPQTTLVLRFVPTRDLATAESAALLRLHDACLRDFLEGALFDASLAGIEQTIDTSLEGVRITVTGYGDSPVRYATYLAENLHSFTVTPARFEARKESVLRSLRSYPQTEAYMLARDRRDALTREFFFLPPQLLPRVESATWPEVQAFAQKYFARGKLEAVIHGHLSPEAAVAATRAIAKEIGAAPAPEASLLRRRHLIIRPGENVLDAAEIAGVNSAFIRDYVLPDDSPATRATALLLANFFGDPFFTELRTNQQLGYIVGSNASASNRQRYFTFVIQSSGYAPDELRQRAEKFIATLPAALAAVPDQQWATLKAGARANLETKPKSIAEKAERFFDSAFVYDGEWNRREAALAALDQLTKEQAVALLTNALAPESARSRTILLHTKAHPPAAAVSATFSDRDAWKSSREFN